MPGAFLHKKSLLDQFGDDYKMVNPIKARRTERQWENPIIRRQREKGIQDWASSFAGKRHYRKLARFNAMRNESTELSVFDIVEAIKKADAATQSDERPFVIDIDDKGSRVDVWLKSKETGKDIWNPSWGVVTGVKKIATYDTDENGSADVVGYDPYGSAEDITAFFTRAFNEAAGVKGEAYSGARFDKHDIAQALSKALHNDDNSYIIRSVDKKGAEPSYAYAENKEGYDAWYVYDDGTVEFEFDGEPQRKKKIDSLDKLESTILQLFGLLTGSWESKKSEEKDRLAGYKPYSFKVKSKDPTVLKNDAEAVLTEFAEDVVDNTSFKFDYDWYDRSWELTDTKTNQVFSKGTFLFKDFAESPLYLDDGVRAKPAGMKLRIWMAVSDADESKKQANEMIGNKKWVIRIKRLGKNYYVCSSSFRVNKAFRYPSLGGPFVCSDWDITERDIAKYDNYNDAKKAWDGMAQVIRGGLPFYKEGEDYEIVQVNFSMMGESKKSEGNYRVKIGWKNAYDQDCDLDLIVSAPDEGTAGERGIAYVDDHIPHPRNRRVVSVRPYVEEGKKSETSEDAPVIAYIREHYYGLGDRDRRFELSGATLFDKLISLNAANALGRIGPAEGSDAWKKLDANEVKYYKGLQDQARAVKTLQDMGKFLAKRYRSSKSGIVCALRQGDKAVWVNPKADDSLCDQEWKGPDARWLENAVMPSEKKTETLEFEKGHKDSRGEDAPWVIRDHEGGKVLASFAKKADAEAHLERMQRYSKGESLRETLHESRLKKFGRTGKLAKSFEASENQPVSCFAVGKHVEDQSFDRFMAILKDTILKGGQAVELAEHPDCSKTLVIRGKLKAPEVADIMKHHGAEVYFTDAIINAEGLPDRVKSEAAEDTPVTLYVREHYYGLGDKDQRFVLTGETLFDKLLSLYDAHALGNIGPAEGSDAWKRLDKDEVKYFKDLQDQAKAVKTLKDMGKFLVKRYPDKKSVVCAIRQGDDAVWVNPKADDKLSRQEWTGPDAEWLESKCFGWESHVAKNEGSSVDGEAHLYLSSQRTGFDCEFDIRDNAIGTVCISEEDLKKAVTEGVDAALWDSVKDLLDWGSLRDAVSDSKIVVGDISGYSWSSPSQYFEDPGDGGVSVTLHLSGDGLSAGVDTLLYLLSESVLDALSDKGGYMGYSEDGKDKMLAAAKADGSIQETLQGLGLGFEAIEDLFDMSNGPVGQAVYSTLLALDGSEDSN